MPHSRRSLALDQGTDPGRGPLVARTPTDKQVGHRRDQVPVGALGAGRDHLETVGSMADQLRRLLARRCWIVAGVGSCRTGGCVRDWLAEQTQEFRDAVELVIIDPSAPYASGIRAALPGVQIAVDKWHLVALANQMVTEVRQRVTRELLGRRGTIADPRWSTGGCC